MKESLSAPSLLFRVVCVREREREREGGGGGGTGVASPHHIVGEEISHS